MSVLTLKTITITEVLLILVVLSGIGYKVFDKIIGSNCTKVSFCGCSCERIPLDNEQAIEILNNTPHINTEQLHDIVIQEISKDLEKQ